METIDRSASLELKCGRCNNPIAADDRFCGHCGADVAVASEASLREDVFNVLTPTLVYYFVTLLLLAAYKLTPIFPDGLQGSVIISGLDILVVLIFWGYHFNEVKFLFSFSGFNFGTAFKTAVGALSGAVVVTLIAQLIQVSIYEDVYYNPYLYEDTSHPWLWSVIMICVQPAIFEEVAFRGFLFNNLQKVTTGRSAVYVTGFLFGILHLSFISLIWLVPIGLVFAHLRMKYNTLWYGIIGHFAYNFSIIAMEFWL